MSESREDGNTPEFPKAERVQGLKNKRNRRKTTLDS